MFAPPMLHSSRLSPIFVSVSDVDYLLLLTASVNTHGCGETPGVILLRSSGGRGFKKSRVKENIQI